MVTTLDAAANGAPWGNSSNAVHAGTPEATISSCPGKPVASDGCPLGLADPWNATPGGDPLAGFSLMGEPQITLARTAKCDVLELSEDMPSQRVYPVPDRARILERESGVLAPPSLGRHEGRRAARRGLQPVQSSKLGESERDGWFDELCGS